MILAGSAAAGVFVGAGVYLMLARSTQRVAIGFLLLTNGVNLAVLASAGFVPGSRPPLVGEGPAPMADPLPQAFVLTAIVIGFGATALLLALAERGYRELGTDHVDPETR